MFTKMRDKSLQRIETAGAAVLGGAPPVFESLEHRLLLSAIDPAVDGLIGVNKYIVPPQVHYTGQVAYDAGTQAFDVGATPSYWIGPSGQSLSFIEECDILAEIAVSPSGTWGDDGNYYLPLDATHYMCRKVSQTQFDALDKSGSEFETPPGSYVADANPNLFYYMFEDTPGFAPDSDRDFNDFMVKVEVDEATIQATLTPWDLPGSPYQMFLEDPFGGLPPQPIAQWGQTAQSLVVSGTNTASLDLHIQVDNSGNLVGGVPGDDLRIFGKVDNHSGVLLTGEIQQFGFRDGYYDEYDLVFKPTGGELMPYFQTMDGGVYMLSIGSSFTGDFTTDFDGYAFGYLGPIEQPGISMDTFIRVDGAGEEPYGDDADQAPGVEIALGDAVTWTYVVTNTGSVPVTDVTVTDDNATPGDTSDDFNPAPIMQNGSNIGDTDMDGLLDVGETWLYRHWDIADTEGQFTNAAKADAYFPPRNAWVQAEDPTNYHAALEATDAALLDERPDVLMMRYTGDGPEATSHCQDPATVSVTGDPNDMPVVHIIAADKQDLSQPNVRIFFDGEVSLGGLFAIDAAEAGAGRLSSTTFIFIQDASGNLLQTAKFHTSCSQPLVLGDQFGAAKLYGYLGDGGTRLGLVPVEMLTSLSGFVYADFNNDGLVDFNERSIANAQVTLSGTDDRGQQVDRTEKTDSNGVYFFESLRPGNYTITEVTQPFAHADGIDTLGTAGGAVGNDVFTNIDLKPYVDGVNYNFGERPLAGTVQSKQTATIAFWAGRNGQELIKNLNGGQESKQLGDWLAATFPNMYQSLAGKANMNVAQSFMHLFKKAMRKDKYNEVLELEAQAMATAMAVYVTNSSLAGFAAVDYGFVVSSNGVGASIWNVGTSGAAFGVADGTEMSVIDLLLAANERTQDGTLHCESQELDVLLRTLANEVFKAINEMGI